MSRPALQVGKPRLGTLYLGLNDPGRPAMAHDTGDEIEVTLNFDHGDPVERRLVGRTVRWGDDPDYAKHDYSLPQQAWFVDPHGVVCFVAPTGRSTSLASRQEARLRFAYAVEVGGVGISYERVNAMQSRIQGLEQWIPISCISHDFVTDGDATSSVFTLRRQEPLRISRRLNAQLRPTYSFTSSAVPGETKFQDEIRVKTSSNRVRPWSEHLDIHRGVRDLIVVAGWQDYGSWDLIVSRQDDPERALAGNPLAERWAKVSTYAVARPGSHGGDRSNFLFDFEDVGVAGVRRWFRLRDLYRRAIAGMIHSVGLPGVALETAVSEAGAALEHLGYGIAVQRSEVPGRHLESHLRRVAETLHGDLRFDLGTWPATIRRCVQHRETPRSARWLDGARLGQRPARGEVDLPGLGCE